MICSCPSLDDTLVNLGDVYLGRVGEEMAISLLRNLKTNGINTVLLRGNHDSKRMGKLGGMGWSWVCESTTLTYHGKRLLLTHEAATSFEGDSPRRSGRIGSL